MNDLHNEIWSSWYSDEIEIGNPVRQQITSQMRDQVRNRVSIPIWNQMRPLVSFELHDQLKVDFNREGV